jgi:hypothetical protein
MRFQTATNLYELKLALESLDRDGRWIYRGHTDASWKLIPSVFRGVDQLKPPYDLGDAEWITQLERNVYREFGKNVGRYGAPISEWEALAVAQHYGCPTRLLDWTRNASVAAYFALESRKPVAAAIWCFNINNYPFPSFLGRTSKTYAHRVEVLKGLAKIREPSFFQPVSKPISASSSDPQSKNPMEQLESGVVVILDPPRDEARITAQEGLFTLHYSFDDGDLVWDFTDHLSAIENGSGKDLLVKIEIPASHREELCRSLERTENWNWHRLFPDLVGLGQWLAKTRADEFASMTADRK